MAKTPKFFARTTKVRKSAPSDIMAAFAPDTPESEIIESILHKRDALQNQLRDTYRQWLINSAFSRGQQFHILHRNEDRLIRLKEPRGRKQVMDDMVGPWKRHQMSNIVMAMPAFECVPVNENSQQRTVARFGTHLLTHYLDTWEFTSQYIDMAAYLIDFGNAFISAVYNEKTGKYESKPLIDAMTGTQVVNESGKEEYDRYEIGDIVSNVMMPHSILCTQDPSPLDDKPWIIVRNGRSFDYFKEHYENADEITQEQEEPYHTYNISRITSVRAGSGYEYESCYANEMIYMQKPSPINETGVMCVVANGVLLKPRGWEKKVEIWPFENLLSYPIEHVYFPKEPGEFFARSPIEPQIPLQKSLNLLWSTVIENAEQMGHTKWLIPEQADIPYNSITDMPDIVRFTYPFKPEQSDIKPMPDYIAGGAIDRLKSAIRDVQNYHGASLGGAVAGVRSDAHAQNLQEQDLLPMSTLDTLIEAAFERFGEKVLLIAAEKLVDERLIRYTDSSGNAEYEQFKGAFIGSGPYKVKVRLQNKHMRTKNATIQQIFGFYNAGLIANPITKQPDPMRALKLLEFAIPGTVDEDFKIHSKIAVNENHRLMNGERAFVTTYQNHMIHIMEHNDFRNSPEYYEMLMNPDEGNNMQIMQAFEEHVNGHSQVQMAALGQIQQPMSGQSGQGAGQNQQVQARQNRASVNKSVG